MHPGIGSAGLSPAEQGSVQQEDAAARSDDLLACVFQTRGASGEQAENLPHSAENGRAVDAVAAGASWSCV
jgi:hypothetical protein